MDTLLKAAGVLDRISRFVGKLASWLILPLIALIMFDVITRKIHFINQWSAEITMEYGYSVSFILQDLEWHLHGALLMMTFGFGYLMDAHVRVDIFREHLGRRGQVWLETIGLAIGGIPFVILMIWFAWVMTHASWLQGEGSESQVGVGMRYVIKSFLIWGFVVLLMAALATLFRCIAYLFGDHETKAIAEEEIQFFSHVEHLPKVVLDDTTPGIEGTRT
jgi:TRAP-type mannitol/chloroaromatic compound transport system permease small subunit